LTTVTVSSRINAPIGRVFEQFTDLEHGTAHVSGIKKIEVLTQGVFQLGTRWHETREVLGRTDSAEMEVTSFERNKRYTITHHKAGVRIDTVFSFEPAEGGTKVSIEFELGAGALAWLVTPFSWAIAGKVRDVLGHDIADLKKSIEK